MNHRSRRQRKLGRRICISTAHNFKESKRRPNKSAEVYRNTSKNSKPKQSMTIPNSTSLIDLKNRSPP